jgi:CheY-like chemotaxis protein
MYRPLMGNVDVVELPTSRPTTVRILVVDDYEPWCRFVRSKLREQPGLEVIGEAADGLDAVRKAQQLQPHLIVLDIGLPALNGIEAARRIRKLSPDSKILFLSENREWYIAKEAISIGGRGYVIKSDAPTNLLPAIEVVLQGKLFLSDTLPSRSFDKSVGDYPPALTNCHEVAFYADDASLVDGYAGFIESALRIGNAVIAVTTEAHRSRLFTRLEAGGLDVDATIGRGTFISLDASDAGSKLTVNDMPDPIRCRKVIGDLITSAAKAVAGEHDRVQVCGEIAPTLLANRNAEGAIKLEHLWDEIARPYGVQTLCGYLRTAFMSRDSTGLFEQICAEHSLIHGSRSYRGTA